ncbi:murein biosynthesis integral membrane protein MurJ [Candidatus Woesebacteria bacterium RIFCSPLOWO2_01_FULL_39_23]|uniref:Probable lipid II flippase MurJ n=2 Tax=Microgenomates group TaxID=1794810 RepID=A0A0H4T6B1_9BACT|nr:putative protein, virulence factor [uncultured Microgenomates bacterium Rifle_16ft_4_minimus_37633]OGM13831.1 MAG: murein biosynthesis integral membrane protein MurJ [Candidatus Woesebacteria bacterium RBG_16_40_11]OGM27781.1 MAG: murein biosynthesis integral membrane protein MurJ [Candidatus Woesebacteria bacterium RIFCSPHIGHO2_01_FULL_40_22]OGM36205.1 MAG: murein biosynthesis integral membrane protein MurJ [Candidatus Woesebacteria bacterium RIFCSPHIGHO2_12_FULL_38_9]OGM62203.1 MAG: murein
MFKKIIEKGKKVFIEPQGSVLSAASLIMLMIVGSRILGLVRQRTLAHFFTPDDLSLFFAAFRLPDLIFEVLVFGTFSSAFIPVFAKALKGGNHRAWNTASTIVNLGLTIFIIFAIVIGVAANPIYEIFTPGYSFAEREVIVKLTRILFYAQGFFVVSYVLTGVLESLRRFLVPALAPLFYNIGIILGTVLLGPKLGLMGPALGVVIGAFCHFLIQLPLAVKLGFRFRPKIEIDEDVKKIGKLAGPRLLEVSFLQVSKLAELFFSSLISRASYAYYTFGNTLQLLPVGLFGTSIAKAALPTLSSEADNTSKFKQTFLSALYQLVFLSAPVATLLIVLRVPIIRLVYGTDIFGWEATVQTGYVLSAFAVGVVFQASAALLARAFYALHDTKTPVTVSIISILSTISADFIFIKIYGFGVWGLALALTVGSIFQSVTLFYLINKKMLHSSMLTLIKPMVKLVFASFMSGAIMFFLLKIFDRSVWIKRLSFLGKIEATKTLAFERFVLDTRYTINLLILTIFVSVIGASVYLGIAYLMKSEELNVFVNLIKRTLVKHKISPIPEQEPEPISPTPGDTT